MADARLLRIVTITTFLPAFGLGIAHGTLSHDLVPAIGLVPLAFSSSFAIFLLSRHRKRAKAKQRQSDAEAEEAGTSQSQEETAHNHGDDELQSLLARPHDHSSGPVAHPILVFLADSILAAALMVVLVFTWIRAGSAYSAELAMLAAYTTIPLLINFSIHLYLSLREFAIGLALRDLLRWTAWQSVPPGCPHCGSRLRPDSLPTIPWYESMSAPEVSLPKVQFRAPSMPKVSLPNIRWNAVKAPEWKTPSWLRIRGRGEQESEYARLFVDERPDGDSEHGGYQDVPDHSVAGPSVATPENEPVVEEIVVARKDKKSKNTPPIFGDGETSWA